MLELALKSLYDLDDIVSIVKHELGPANFNTVNGVRKEQKHKHGFTVFKLIMISLLYGTKSLNYIVNVNIDTVTASNHSHFTSS